MDRSNYIKHAGKVWSRLAPELAKLREKVPHFAHTTQELGRSGLILARPVWARPNARIAQVLEPIVASAALVTLLGAIATGLASLFGFVAALGMALLILRFIFGIKVDAPDLNFST